jgi:hypothetical protein
MMAERELPWCPGECDSCLFFRERPIRGSAPIPDIGLCHHPDGPLDPHTTRFSYEMRVLALSGMVSSGMVCARFQQRQEKAA